MERKKEQRQAELYRILLNQGKTKVRDLAMQLQVTPETVRSDLSDMVNQRKIIREHGYARPISSVAEVPFRMREMENLQEKRRIGFRALHEVKPNQTVFLDAGSTSVLGLPALARNANITIVTNNIPLAYEAGLLGFQVMVCSGALSNVGFRTYGVISSEILRDLTIDCAILGCDGIDCAKNFTTLAFNEVGIKRVVLSRSKRNIVMMDQTKFESSASFNFASFKEIDCLVTCALRPEQREKLKMIPEIIEV